MGIIGIIVIIVLILAVVFLALIIANVPVSQRQLNIIFLIMIILLCLERTGWLA